MRRAPWLGPAPAPQRRASAGPLAAPPALPLIQTIHGLPPTAPSQPDPAATIPRPLIFDDVLRAERGEGPAAAQPPPGLTSTQPLRSPAQPARPPEAAQAPAPLREHPSAPPPSLAAAIVAPSGLVPAAPPPPPPQGLGSTQSMPAQPIPRMPYAPMAP